MDGYTHALITGKYEFNSSVECFEKVLGHISERKVSKILFDYHKMYGKIPGTEMIDFAKKTTEIWMGYRIAGKLNRIKIAYLSSEENYDPHQLGKKIAAIRGVNFIKITTDHMEALEFLGIEH